MSEPNETRGVTGNCPYWTAEEQLMHDRNALREVANTAREEGRMEARMQIWMERDEAHVTRHYKKGKSIAEIADMFDLEVALVESIIEEYDRQNGDTK